MAIQTENKNMKHLKFWPSVMSLSTTVPVSNRETEPLQDIIILLS
jgi:hypothetical protein